MMFRRWRRTRLTAEASEHVAAPAPRPSAADLRGEHIFDLLHGKLSEFIGSSGEWTLVRRTDADSDRIFHAIVTHQIAAELTRSILDERDNVAVVVPEGEQQLALDWEPTPLVVWAEPLGAHVAMPAAPDADAAADPMDETGADAPANDAETDEASDAQAPLHARAA
ncbi:hypothetical protein [Agromyces soli]|uniref:Uncharacterized protein n=1 Tax=Agromyces soli TaxID=659012 RepID=A0ABY4ASE3_9MICO|nr:hypothetical protein [Agromyces soli]UOE25081.1 hypothetical protein MTP13_12060 [Agromyces soli]